jgi:hypothetical protein
VFFVTLTDARQVVNPDEDSDENPTIAQIASVYRHLLRGLNYVGMLDPGLYVSAQRTHDVDRFIHYHLHALVWGITKKKLDAILEDIRPEIWPLLSYATAADVKLVRKHSLLQMVWYVAKAPRKQYQLWRRRRGSLKQYKRQINGVNSVRLFAAMQDITLDQLTLAGGEGLRVLNRARRDVDRVCRAERD